MLHKRAGKQTLATDYKAAERWLLGKQALKACAERYAFGVAVIHSLEQPKAATLDFGA